MKRVFGAAHARHVGFQPTFLLIVHIIDNQHFEIGLGQGACFGRQHRFVVMLIVINAVTLQGDRPSPVRASGQGAGDAIDGK